MTNHEEIIRIRYILKKAIIGQEDLVNNLIIALLANGHLLVEGAPGLAKTRAIKELSELIEASFHRIQFTPDLLPADLTGTEIYRPQDGSFHFQKGPLFHNILLADEINRAPAKVQSALLEAMAEGQITVGSETYPLARLFLVMATQNPLEQEGTYTLPEAQLDRFLMHVFVHYPNAETERKILQLVRDEDQPQTPKKPHARITQATLFSAREEILTLHMSDEVEEYLVRIVLATRDPAPYNPQLRQWINYGASPRATIALDRCARAHAWLEGREYVSPSDIQAVVYNVLRHRILMSFDAEAQGISSDKFIQTLLEHIAVP